MRDDTISIALTRPHALVLFELIASLESRLTAGAIDEAEQRALWSVEGQLESNLAEVVSPNYKDLLIDAKRRVLETS